MEEFKKRFNVSRETCRRLEEFYELLLKWNASINLISKTTEGEIWERHIADSLQIKDLVSGKVIDIGTGAGFPGAVLALSGIDNIHLVEKSAKKCSFLHKVKSDIGGDFEIINQRIEDIKLENIDVITCRGFASIKKILQLTSQLVTKEGRFILMKGESYEREIKEAKESGWKFKYDAIPSVTSKNGVVLILSNVAKNG
jgi:16S rRNA (guanine527-N7)-methyltransferase